MEDDVNPSKVVGKICYVSHVSDHYLHSSVTQVSSRFLLRSRQSLHFVTGIEKCANEIISPRVPYFP